MRTHKKSEIDFIDWGGKVVGAVGVLGIAAYIAGYIKFYFYYRALKCSWVLDLHSVQDVIVNGALDVGLCSFTAVPLFFYYKSSVNIDNNGRRIVGYFLVGLIIAIAAAVILLDYKFDEKAGDLMVYAGMYLIYGVSVATIARYSAEEKSYRYLLATFGGFVFTSVFSSSLVNSQKTFSLIDERFGFHYKIVGANGSESVLVGTVGGKYLIHVCGEHNRFRLIAPSEKWIVAPRGSQTCGVNYSDN